MTLATDGPPHCGNCDRVVVLTWTFCASCGAPLDDDASPPASRGAGEAARQGPSRGADRDGEDDDQLEPGELAERRGEPFDHTDPVDLQIAYDRHETMAAAAEEFAVSYASVRLALIDEGIHEPDRYGTDTNSATAR